MATARPPATSERRRTRDTLPPDQPDGVRGLAGAAREPGHRLGEVGVEEPVGGWPADGREGLPVGREQPLACRWAVGRERSGQGAGGPRGEVGLGGPPEGLGRDRGADEGALAREGAQQRSRHRGVVRPRRPGRCRDRVGRRGHRGGRFAPEGAVGAGEVGDAAEQGGAGRAGGRAVLEDEVPPSTQLGEHGRRELAGTGGLQRGDEGDGLEVGPAGRHEAAEVVLDRERHATIVPPGGATTRGAHALRSR